MPASSLDQNTSDNQIIPDTVSDEEL
jgi:hypothetical protein